MVDLPLRICGMTLRLRGEDRRFLAAAARRYAPFRGGGTPDVRLELETAGRPLRARMDEPRLSRGRLERHDFELYGGRAVVLRVPSALDSLLRIVTSLAMLRRGGFLCHAAAVDGWLFPGRSGAGKSTLGRAVPRGRLLADELVGVAGGRLHGTPFWGDFRAGRNNGARRLEAVFLLDRRAPRGVRRVAKSEALARILECALCFSDGSAAARRVLATARRCVSVPAFVVSYDARRTGFAALERMLREALR